MAEAFACLHRDVRVDGTELDVDGLLADHHAFDAPLAFVVGAPALHAVASTRARVKLASRDGRDAGPQANHVHDQTWGPWRYLRGRAAALQWAGMTAPRGVVAVLLGCLLLALSTPSVAAGDPAQARAAFDEGQKRFLAGEYREALASFERGFLATDDPAFLLNIAQCHRSLGQPKDALMMYRLYLRSSPDYVNRDARSVATKAVGELEAELAAARATPLPAAAPGALPVLEPLPEGDIAKASTTPASPPVDTGATARHLRLAAMVCGGVGLVSAATGVYYWTRASSLSDSANKAATYDPGSYDQGKRAETMQWIFYGVGAAAIATGATLYLYGRYVPAGKQANVSLAPLVGPGAAGLGAQGTF